MTAVTVTVRDANTKIWHQVRCTTGQTTPYWLTDLDLLYGRNTHWVACGTIFDMQSCLVTTLACAKAAAVAERASWWLQLTMPQVAEDRCAARSVKYRVLLQA